MENLENLSYRGYFFGNMYLSSIQQGIQAAHVMQKMLTEYWPMSSPAAAILTKWCREDKTIILLNGGYQSSLEELYTDLMLWSNDGRDYPVGRFHEEPDALNGAVTSVGIVLPDYVFSIPEEDEEDPLEFGSKDYLIRERIREFRLAT